MKQINLYCPNCSVKLKFSDVKTSRNVSICLMCGFILFTSDVDLPNYRRNLLLKAQMETEIRSICALTGKTVEFIEKFIAEEKISLDELKCLGQKIARVEKTEENY